MDTAAWVFVVDDDPAIRKALTRLFRSVGWQAEAFASAAEFLQSERPEAPSCLVLDVQMPDLDGLALQHGLYKSRLSLPIVFITAFPDIPITVQAIKSGAVDFLPKPVDDDALLNAVRQALAQGAQEREASSEASALWERYERLSPREREVLAYVVGGLLNKQIAHRLDVTEKTIKVHRGQVMRKMEAASLAELVRMAEKLGIEGPDDQPAPVRARTVSAS
jgi:FixJ family two-component response regulator